MWLSAKMKLSIIFIGSLIALCHGEQRIAGGEVTTINQFPYATALLTNSGSGLAFRHACGGTILTNNAILSAASCFFTGSNVHSPSWWRARVGSSFSEAGGTIYLVSRITTHHEYQPDTYNNNIAVLRTRFNIVFSPGVVEQAFLAGRAYQYTAFNPVVAIGWGATSASGSWSDQLRQVQVWLVDQQLCTNRYSAENFTVSPNLACVGWLDVGIRGQCEGDQGSPLVANGIVVGVFSYTHGCANDWLPDLNTKLPLYNDWVIRTAIAN